MSSYCSENNFFQTFLFLLAYFIGILLILHVVNLCGPLNKLVEKLGVDTYQYWMVTQNSMSSLDIFPSPYFDVFSFPQTYELNYRANVPKVPRRFRCIKVKLTRLESNIISDLIGIDYIITIL